MSYFTRVEFTFADGRPPRTEDILARARSYLESHPKGYSTEHVLEDLRVGIKKEEVDFKGIYSDDIEGLMEHVSAGFPGVFFFVRGQGEEFPDVWLRLFKEGRIVFRAGPFEEELGSTLGEG